MQRDGRGELGRVALTTAMDRYADGDREAFGEVYDLLAPRLKGFFGRQTRDEGRAEDLVQQTLLQMHCARQSFVRGSDVIPWAFAIGRRLLIDSQRRTKKEHLFATADAQSAAQASRVERAEVPDEVVANRQLAERVERELRRLPEAQRTAWELLREEGLSVAQAAQVLGVTIVAVKLRAHRAYEALRGVLEAEEADALGRSPAEEAAP